MGGLLSLRGAISPLIVLLLTPTHWTHLVKTVRAESGDERSFADRSISQGDQSDGVRRGHLTSVHGHLDMLLQWWSGGVVHILSLPALLCDWLTDTRCSLHTVSPPQSSRDLLRQSEDAVLLFIVTTEARPCALWSVKIFSFKLNLFTQVRLIPDFPTVSPTLPWLDQRD